MIDSSTPGRRTPRRLPSATRTTAALFVAVALASGGAAGASAAEAQPPPAASDAVPAPNRALVEDSYAYLGTEFPHFFANANQGSAYELRRAEALFTLARSYVSGDVTPAYRDRLISWVRRTLTDPAHMPDLHAGIDMRQQQYYLLTLALIWHTPALKAELDPTEQGKVLLMAQAAVASTAYVSADYTAAGAPRADNMRITMDGDPNCWPQGNPNWTEAILGSLLAGGDILGLDQVGGFLNGYSHDAFTKQLGDAGLTAVRDTFAKTPASVVESYVTTIDDNEEKGKPFFRNTRLGSLAADPFRFYHDAVASYTYRLTATEGDFVGEPGRATEFQGSDASGVRDSLPYVLHGLNHSLGNRYLLTFEGHWNAAGDEDLRAELERLMRVGFSDALGKAQNGYWTRSNGHEAYDTGAAEFYYPQFRGFAEDFGLWGRVLFSDNFEDAELSGWTADGPWAIVEQPTWSGSTTANEKVVAIPDTPTDATLISSDVGDDVSVYAPVKVASWNASAPGRIGILGKYRGPADHYFAGVDAAAGEAQIIRVVGGQPQVLARQPVDLVVGTVHQVKAVFAADGTVDLRIDGGPVLSAKDGEPASGPIGLSARGVDAAFDDILVVQGHAGA